jgi:predicted RND superfamily exporter protein
MNFSRLSAPARRPVTTILIAALLAVLALIGALRLHPDTSLQSLFSPGQPAVVALDHVLDDFPTSQELLVLATTPGNQPQPEKLLAFADRLKSSLWHSATEFVSSVTYRTDPLSRDFVTKVVVPNAVFYLSDANFKSALERLTRPQMQQQFNQDETMLSAPGPAAGALAKAIMLDPLRLHDFLDNRLMMSRPFKTYQNSDAFLSPDGRSLLIRITGTKPPNDFNFCRQITAAVTDLAQHANTDNLQLEFSGAYPIAAQSEKSIRHDSISSVIGSVISLGLLFALVFRRSLPGFLITFAPVVLGALYGFGVYSLVSSSVTPLTAVIGAMLAGIGIDYSVFFMIHYQQQRVAGCSPIDSVANTISSIGGALIAAWVTSVVGFVAVGFSSVRMLHDFSIVGSMGLAGAMLCAIFVLPAILVLYDRGRKVPVNIPRFSMRPLLDWIDRHSWMCICLCGSIVLAGVIGLVIAGPRLEMDSDPTVLHPHPNPPLDAEAHISQRMGLSPDSLIVYLKADSPDKLVSLAYRVQEKLTSPKAQEIGVASVWSVASLLPDPGIVQDRKNQVGPAMADRVLADFDSVVAASPFRADAFHSYREFLRTLLTPQSAPTIEDLKPYTQLAETVLPKRSEQNEAITMIFPGKQSNRQEFVAHLRELLHDIPGATLTGMSVLGSDTQTTIRQDLPRLIFAALAVCVVYLLLHFRSLSDTMLALLPTAFSLICLLAIARILGAKMNLANIVAVPLLVGIDVDYGIFLISVARRSKKRSEFFTLASATGLAVVLCAGETVAGFGSLAFTSVPAIRSLGWAVAIGVISCAIGSLFFLLPVIIRTRRFEIQPLESGHEPAIRP